jgi:YidC/Oxa1 family membrane protein insertase
MSFLSNILRVAFEFFYGLTHSYGLSIILLTLAIKLVVLPLSIKQTKAMEGMKEIQPKLKELQRKYKSKPEVYQKRMVELYQEHKINPFAGCLPTIVQLLVLWPLVRMLHAYPFPEGEAGFLWLTGMNVPDPMYILPILAGISTFFQMRLTVTDDSQKTMVYFMPIFITAISLNFPAGIAVYWVISNLFAIGQQLYISKYLLAAKEGDK